MLLSMWLSSCAEIQERDKVNDKNRNPEEILELQLTSYNAIPANLSLKSVKSKSSRHILMGMGEKKKRTSKFPMATAVLIASPSWRFKRQQAWQSKDCCPSQRSYIICYINVITFGMLSVTMSHVLTAKSPLELSMKQPEATCWSAKKAATGTSRQGSASRD